MIKNLSGKNQSTSVKHLEVENNKVTSKAKIVNLLSETFSENS